MHGAGGSLTSDFYLTPSLKGNLHKRIDRVNSCWRNESIKPRSQWRIQEFKKGGSRWAKPTCREAAGRVSGLPRGVWGHAPPEKFWKY